MTHSLADNEGALRRPVIAEWCECMVRVPYVVFLERNAYLMYCGSCGVHAQHVKVKVTAGSKVRGARKFGIFDDDRDLAHRFLETVRRNARYGILVAWDNRVTDIACTLLTEQYSRLVHRVALVHVKLPHSTRPGLQFLIAVAEHGHYTKVMTADKRTHTKLTATGWRRVTTVTIGNTQADILRRPLTVENNK